MKKLKNEKVEMTGRESEIYLTTMQTADGLWMLWKNDFKDEGCLWTADFKFKLRGLTLEEPAADDKHRLILELPGAGKTVLKKFNREDRAEEVAYSYSGTC
jgi:hypothetical protein